VPAGSGAVVPLEEDHHSKATNVAVAIVSILPPSAMLVTGARTRGAASRRG
jgi:hypothetical protein